MILSLPSPSVFSIAIHVHRRALRSFTGSSFTLRQESSVNNSVNNNNNSNNDSSYDLSTTRKQDLQHAIRMVRLHDAAGYLPGQLLPKTHMTETYFAVRSFYVETGLRQAATAIVPSNASPSDHLDWWDQSIQSIYKSVNETDECNDATPDNKNSTTKMDNDSHQHHPTLRLLRSLIQQQNLSKSYFDDMIRGRRLDGSVKQYETLSELIDHAQLSCGSLFALILESATASQNQHEPAHVAAQYLAKAHGLTNALRYSIPLVSTTGKLILPKDLCIKYGVASPRYLLSALGQGDVACQTALRHVVKDIVDQARQDLQQARDMRESILNHIPSAASTTATSVKKVNDTVCAVFLPAIPTEMFLNRLERFDYDLTDKNLRHVGLWEPTMTMVRMMISYYQKKY